MQVELSIEELEIISVWADRCDNSGYVFKGSYELETRIEGMIEEAKELESMDFDDCAGGACKL